MLFSLKENQPADFHSAETVIELMKRKQVKPLFTLLFLLHWREECANISLQCPKIESFRLLFTRSLTKEKSNFRMKTQK